ncbi:MAG: FecR family protein [Planctomycetota bacterium]
MRGELDPALPDAPESCLRAALGAVANLRGGAESNAAPMDSPRRRVGLFLRPVLIPWLAAAACLAVVLAVFAVAGLRARGYGKLIECEGTVLVRYANGVEEECGARDAIPVSCEIALGPESMCRIEFGKGLEMGVREGSRLRVVERGRFELVSGSVHVRAAEDADAGLQTPEGAVRARDAEFTLSAREGKTILQVIKGKVLLKNGRGESAVGPMEECTAVANQAPGPPCSVGLAHVWRIDNPHPDPIIRWVLLDGFDREEDWLENWWAYVPESDERIRLNTEQPKEGKGCAEIRRRRTDRGLIGMWREMELPPDADRLRFWVCRKTSCPKAVLTIQLGATADLAGPSNCYHVPLGALPAGWARREVDLKKDMCGKDGIAFRPAAIRAIRILGPDSPIDTVVLIDHLECRVVERR